MATYTRDTQLTFRTGSDVSQAQANQRAEDIFRSFLSTYVGQLDGLKRDGETAPDLAAITGMTTAQMKPWVQRVMRVWIRESARAFDVQAADRAHVRPVREKVYGTEDPE